MVLHFLFPLTICFLLAGCAAVGNQGKITYVVVTATSPGSGPGAAAGALPNAPTAAAPVNTPGIAVPAGPTAPAATAEAVRPAAVVPATGNQAQVSFDQLLDYNVVDANGNELGEVKDAVIDRSVGDNGQGIIPYLIVDSNLREDWYIPVPWRNIQVRPDLQAVALQVNANQLAAAPGFHDKAWPGNFDGLKNAVQNFWVNPGKAAGMAPVLPGGIVASYLRASEVMSIDIFDPQGIKLGEIKDVAVDWKNSQPGTAHTAQFRYLLMEMDSDLGVEDRMIPIPWRLVRVIHGQENLNLNLQQNQVMNAPNFVQGSQPDLYAEPWSSQIKQFWP